MRPAIWRSAGVVVPLVLIAGLLATGPAAADPGPDLREELAEAEAEEVRAFLDELFARRPDERWADSEAARLVRFPSGETLPVVAGPVEPGEEHHDPHGSGLPLLDVSGDRRSTQLSADVSADELARSGDERFDVARIDPALVVCLQRLRDALDEPVTVTSGYRSHAYNADLYERRGEEPTDSRHSSGQAADVTVAGRTGLEVARAAAEVCGCDVGLGVGDEFAHIDVRGVPARWSYLDGASGRGAVDALDAHRTQRCDAAAATPRPRTNGLGMTPGGLLAAPDAVVAGLRDALEVGDWPLAVGLSTAYGLRNENQLTDMIFFVDHPELEGRRLDAGDHALARLWIRMRDEIVRPALQRLTAAGPAPAGPVRPSSWVREVWGGHECERAVAMVGVEVLGRRAAGHPQAAEAFAALGSALAATGYAAADVGIYNCREVRGSTDAWSLHAYGLAVDIDPSCHPHRLGAGGPARFSPAATQEQRCADVRAGLADTAFTPEQVEAVEGIRTVDGHQVFSWGGRWRRSPDAMHFQINVSPDELRRGLETDS